MMYDTYFHASCHFPGHMTRVELSLARNDYMANGVRTLDGGTI